MENPSTTGERLLRLPEVQHQTGLGKSAIYSRVKAGTFPAPVKLGPRASAWSLSSIENWISDRIREGRRGR